MAVVIKNLIHALKLSYYYSTNELAFKITFDKIINFQFNSIEIIDILIR